MVLNKIKWPIYAALLLAGCTGIPFADTNGMNKNSLTFRSPHGTSAIHSFLPTTLEFDENKVTAYSRGWQTSLKPQVEYTGIGKYTLDMTPALQAQIDQITEALSSRDIEDVDPKSTKPVLAYNFVRNGERYSGAYNYQFNTEFNVKVNAFSSVYDKVLASGEQQIGFTPDFSVSQSDKGIEITLRLENTGKQEIAVADPSNWAESVTRLTPNYVQLEAYHDQTGFDLTLSKNFQVSRASDAPESLIIAPGETASLDFRIPYEAIVYDSRLPSKKIQSGAYDFFGELRIEIESPEEISGTVFTYTDPLNGIYLKNPEPNP